MWLRGLVIAIATNGSRRSLEYRMSSATFGLTAKRQIRSRWGPVIR